MNGNGNLFDIWLVREKWERDFRLDHGLFIAASDPEYDYVWLRDNLYAVLAYLSLGDKYNAWKTMRKILDTLKYGTENAYRFHKTSGQDVRAAFYNCNPLTIKWHRNLFRCDKWCHHQNDAIGLFLFVLARLEQSGVWVIQRNDSSDIDYVQNLIYAIGALRYALIGDFGHWEECELVRTSSVGPILAALYAIRDLGLWDVPENLIVDGQAALDYHLPFDSKGECGRHSGYTHCCDAAQLFLIWPLNLVDRKTAREIIKRLVEGHWHDGQFFHKLLGDSGFLRYFGDEYWRTAAGQAQWPMFFFVLSIIHSQWEEYDWADFWFGEACKKMRSHAVPELIEAGNGPNRDLAWGASIGIIAYQALPAYLKAKYGGLSVAA